MSKLTYSKQTKIAGSKTITVNVARNGVPFGQIMTFKNTRTTWHPWHAIPLKGEHKAFYEGELGRNFDDAKAYMESVA